MNRRTIAAVAVLACQLTAGCRPVPVAGPGGLTTFPASAGSDTLLAVRHLAVSDPLAEGGQEPLVLRTP